MNLKVNKSVKLIISKEEMLLIQQSECPKDNSLYGNLYDVVHGMVSLTQSEFLNSKTFDNKARTVLTSTKNILIDNIIKEWYSYDYELITSKEIHCRLCNHKNKWIHYIRNRINGNELNVGSECVKKFPNIEITDFVSNKRTELLKKYNEDKNRIVFSEMEIAEPNFISDCAKKFDEFKIMLEIDLYLSLSKTIDNLRLIKSSYIKNGGNINEVKIRYNELKTEFNDLWESAIIFYNRNKDNPLICKKYVSDWLKKEYPIIWEKVAINKGLLNEETLAYVHLKPYISNHVSVFKKRINNSSIKLLRNDGDSLLFSLEDSTYRIPLYFRVRDNDFMKHIGCHCLIANDYRYGRKELESIIYIDKNNNTFEALYNRFSRIMNSVGFDIVISNGTYYFKKLTQIIKSSKWSTRAIKSEIEYKVISKDIFYTKCTSLIFTDDNEIENKFKLWYNFVTYNNSKWISQKENNDIDQLSASTDFQKQREFI